MDTTLLLKATAMLLVALFAGRLLRNSPAAARHRYWSGAFAALLLLPVLVLTLPAVVVPLPISPPRVVDAIPHASVPPRGPASFSPPAPEIRRAEVRRSTEPAPRRIVPLRTVLLSAWATGTGLALAALLLSLWRVRKLSGSAEELNDPQWTAAAAAIAERLGFRRTVRLLVSEAVATPMAGGLLRPTAFLPSSSREWTPEQRDVVLAHEISHMASRDPLRHLLTRLTVALYWFHPLTWIAVREAGTAREEACDASVLALGTRPSLYATVLLDLAESLPSRPQMLAALPMAQRSHLEMRLMSILKDSRPSTRRLALIPLLLIAPVTVVIAAAQSGRPATPPVVAARVMPAAPAAQPDVQPDVPQMAMQDVTVMPAAPDRRARAWSDCWDSSFEGTFTGSLSTRDDGSNIQIHERIGRGGSSRIIQKRFGDLRLCMVAEDVGDGDMGAPSQWLDDASRWVMEVRGDGLLQKLEDRGGQLSWSSGGRERPIDSSVEAWRTRMLALFDTIWELSSLRGQVSSLRGEISSVHGEHSSLRGEISSLHGHVSSLRGEISSILGEESSMRGEISSIRGHLSSLYGQISSERGAISSLSATHSGQSRATASERESIASIIKRHEAEIERIEQEIRDYDADAKVAAVERSIARHDARGKVAAVEAQIRAFDLPGRVAEIERRIAALDVQGQVGAIEQKIAALDADRRGRELEHRIEQQFRQLEEAIRRVR